MNKAIGGFFELELNRNNSLHSNAIALNSGRNAFEYILIGKNYKKIFIPYFTCDVLLQPLIRNNIAYDFYSIDESLEPIFDFQNLQLDEAFVYTNYFGLKSEYVKILTSKIENVIIDNSQSFFSMPFNNEDTFYSPRKFFGLPDGGYVYSKKLLSDSFDHDDESISRMSHLIARLAFDAEFGYQDFKNNDRKLDNLPIKLMSKLTSKLIENLDMKNVMITRASNFDYLDNYLNESNLSILTRSDQIPMVYPYRTKNKKIKEALLSKRIYTASYWPNVFVWTNSDAFERNLLNETIYLPIDQRYTYKEMETIVNTILNV